ncbi:uncharacterized protein LOC134245541 [Saccostrea cucullata]|uniref:uncharacterized protein LOC134245541 n=1 Tax=Saccostrea cuccullata TaxID=36930 RepID=UPI002ED65CEA
MDLSVPQTVQYPSSTVRSSTNDFKTTSTRTCSGEILLSKMDTLNAVPLLKFDPNATFKTDDRVLYECANGYRFMNGPLEHVCGNDGAWKGALPYCKRCRCPCSRMKNQVIIKTQEELQNKINVMTEKLKVKKSDLTSVKSRKTSAPDPRPSSKAVGSLIGIGILVFIFAVIIISDFPLLYTHIKYGPYHGR